MSLIPVRDEEFLKASGFEFELTQPGDIHLVLKGWDFPEAYSPGKADILIVIPPGYPMTPLDMWWTSPTVKLGNGALPQASEHHQRYGERQWQRWSRHYQPWRAGVDDLRSFIAAMNKEILLGV
jgi:hypothetical protein